jgi:hypothetical protein
MGLPIYLKIRILAVRMKIIKTGSINDKRAPVFRY